MKKYLYDLMYRLVPAGMIFGSNSKIEAYVDKAVHGRIEPGKAITLGCGVGRETIHLARKGFEVTGVDFSPTAINRARRNAQKAGVAAQFEVDDLTKLTGTYGTFDLVMDFGAFNDLSVNARNLYMENVLPLMAPGGEYVMFAFVKMLPTEEVEQRFKDNFEIEVLDKSPDGGYPGSLVLYAMKRR